MVLPVGEAASDYLRGRCINPDLTSLRTQVQGAQQQVRHTPCTAFRRNAVVKVKDGDTLGAIAARLGLRLDRAFDLKVSSTGELASAVKIDPKDLKPAETVVAERVPVWTLFTVKTAQFPNREALVARFGEALGCRTTEPERCLLDKHVFILDAGPVRVAPPAPSPNPVAPGVNLLHGFGAVLAPLGGRLGAPAYAVFPGGSQLPQTQPPPPPAAAVAALIPAVISEVASGQWPYDVDLIKRTLEAAAQSGAPEPAVLGIADAGLARADGAPLSPDVFVDPPIEEDPPGTAAEDDNGDGVWNNPIGAGVTRPNQPRPDGDVGLCPQAVDYSAWTPAEREAASHGAIVASIAAGLPLRTAAPSISPFLPRIAFFRLIDRACDKQSAISAFPSGVSEGFDFLVQYSDIVNVSYLGPGDKSETMASTIGRKLQSEERLLIIPAGNDLAEDLDQEKFCPACIVASPSVYGLASRRVIVVGAADASLRRTSFYE